MIFPSLTFLFAVGLAFATSSTSGTLGSTTTVNGYIDNPNPCEQPPIACSTDVGEICIDGDEQQAKAFNSAGTSCNVEVYRLEL